MKNCTPNLLVLACLVAGLTPVHAQGSSSILTMLPAIIASTYTPPEPPEPLPPKPVPTAPPTVTWQGREWQQSDNGVKYNWDEAVAYCQNLSLGGHSDWYLPTKDELKSLVVCSNGTPTPLADFPTTEPWNCGDDPYSLVDGYKSPTIDDSFSCRNRLFDFYWTSTIKNSNYRFHVSFYRGGSGTGERNLKSFVRCIR